MPQITLISSLNALNFAGKSCICILHLYFAGKSCICILHLYFAGKFCRWILHLLLATGIQWWWRAAQLAFSHHIHLSFQSLTSNVIAADGDCTSLKDPRVSYILTSLTCMMIYMWINITINLKPRFCATTEGLRSFPALFPNNCISVSVTFLNVLNHGSPRYPRGVPGRLRHIKELP